MLRLAFGTTAALSLTFVFGPAIAADAPTQLIGKSVRLSWTDARVERKESGEQVSMNQTSSVRLYVSDKRRIFSQFERAVDRGGGGQSRRDSDISGSGRSTLNFHAAGNTLVADQISTGGARRVTVSFDPGFTTCQIAVIYGKSGQRTRHRDLANAQWLELVSVNVTATSCSVASGNIFGN